MIYIHNNTGKWFKKLVNARKKAIEDILRERSSGWMRSSPHDATRDYISIIDKKTRKPKPIGYVGYMREGDSVKFYWRPSKKSESVYLNRNGTSKGKIPKSKWDELLI